MISPMVYLWESSFFSPSIGRKVSERLHPANDLALFVRQNGRAEADGNFFSIFIENRDREVQDRFSGFNGLIQGASGPGQMFDLKIS